MTYQPVHDYGVIGDMHSAALVGTDGSLDWPCFPHFGEGAYDETGQKVQELLAERDHIFD